MKKEKKFNLKSFVIATLRRASYRFPARNYALKKARISRNQYVCALCGNGVFYKRKQIQIDHIEPVIPIETGWQDFNSFINRMFCDETGFQILCLVHHEAKTLDEKELRKYYRQLMKEKEKE